MRGSPHQRPGWRLPLRLSLGVILVLGLFGSPVDSQVLDAATEKRLVESVDTHLADGLRLLEQTVNMNSGTLNVEGVRQVARVIQPEFEALGMQVEWIDGAAWERAGHLFARRGDRGPHFLLIGHLDTVFEPDSPFQKYEKRGEHHAAGPGTTDMKGGNLVMLLALRALQDVGLLDQAQFTVALIGDEEKAGRPLDKARADLVAAAHKADIAIGFEDGDGDPKTAVIARRGSSTWRLEVQGTPAHSSQIFREDIGAGAIFECSRILNQFHEQLAAERYLTFNPGVIVGGTQVTLDATHNRGTAFGKGNVIAETAQVIGDLRSLSVEQREAAKQTMQRIVDAASPHTSAQLVFDDRYPPMAPTDGNRHLLSLFDAASRDLGFGPVEAVDPARAGAADVAFTAAHVDMAMDGVGLMGTGGHTVDEVADLRTFPIQAKRVAVLLARLIASPELAQPGR